MDKIKINVNPVIKISFPINVSFPIKVTVIVKLFDRLIKVIKKNDKSK